MTDYFWRLLVVEVGAVVVTIRVTYDFVHMSAEARRDWATQIVALLINVTIAVQLLGFDPAPIDLQLPADVVVRSLGVVLGLIACVGLIWPRLVCKSWDSPMKSPQHDAGRALVVRGPYAWIRHPYYAALLAGFLGIELTLASYLFLCIVPLVLVFASVIIRKEEQKLTAVYGSRYTDYAEQNWRLVPFVY